MKAMQQPLPLRHALSDALSVILPPPEDTLLLRACLQPGELGRQACEAWLKREEDSEQQLNREFVKAFLPMLFNAVRTHGIELDNKRLTILRTAAFREELRTQTYRTICRRVFSALAEKKFPVIVIKGAALAETVYPDPTLRHSHDIEIFLEERDLSKIIALLTMLGFIPSGTRSRRYSEGIELTHESGLPLRLHCNLFQIPFYNVALPDIRSRSQTKVISEILMRVLCPADSLFHICGHAAYSPSRETYRWVSDGWFVIDRQRDLDWDVLLDVARRSHLTLPLLVTLNYLTTDLSAAVPSAFLDQLSIAVSKNPLIGQELALFGARSAPRGGFRNLLRKAKGWRGRASVIKWMFLPSPSYLRWVYKVHSPCLLPFYYVERPIRYLSRRIWPFWNGHVCRIDRPVKAVHDSKPVSTNK